MILVTGGTGFIGKVLIRHLVGAGQRVRTLVRPSPRSPELPRGIPVEVTVCGLSDARGLRSAMVGVHTVYHLASVERRGAYASLIDVDIQGTRSVVEAALDAKVQRIIYLSHIGADRSSAYPVAKAKALAEEFIRRSGLGYTIFRTSVVFGQQDGFTTGLARLLYALPFFFLMPGDGSALLQPIWVEDLATCLAWSLEDESTLDNLYEVGGPEHLSFRQILDLVMEAIGIRRSVLSVKVPYLRYLTVLLEAFIPGLPVTIYWMDYLAMNHTCALDTLPRTFSLMPSRISHQLDYLKDENWRISLLRTLFRKR